jgi:3-oxoacyl-[acyl-carrier protein] reductase
VDRKSGWNEMTKSSSLRLEGIVCVVTGAAGGIGQSIAERLAAEGGRVACLDVSEKRLDPMIKEWAKSRAEIRGYTVDVSSRQALLTRFESIERDFGAPIGVLVNNAAWVRFQPLEKLDEEIVDRTLAVGLKGLIWGMQAAVPQMIRRGGGSIINISSTAAHRSLTDSMIYAATKAGVLGLTRAAAVELSPQRIRVNAVLPGMIGTPASLRQYDPATLDARLAVMPLGRFGQSSDIAAAIAYLASDDSSYVQGAELVVDGGWTVAAR